MSLSVKKEKSDLVSCSQIEVGLSHLESKKHENEYLQAIRLNLQFRSHRGSTSVILFTGFQNTEKTILLKSVQYLWLKYRKGVVGTPLWRGPAKAALSHQASHQAGSTLPLYRHCHTLRVDGGGRQSTPWHLLRFFLV